MAKLRKMLGDINSDECVVLMRSIETQNKGTLSTWAIGFAKERYLIIYQEQCPNDFRFGQMITKCEEYLSGSLTLNEIKPVIKEAQQIAREIADNPIAQAAARAISVACSVIQNPASALGFLFYGAAAIAYNEAGLTEESVVYDNLAQRELKHAIESLQKISVSDEPNPVKIKWNC